MINTICVTDALTGLRGVPSNSIHCCVTSPPYFGLRDYQSEGQVGLESTPEAFIQRLVEIFREVRRVLRKDGVCWVNIGDSYARTGGNDRTVSPTASVGNTVRSMKAMPSRSQKAPMGLKEKDLIGIPWMLAFALRADGWYLRQDIIWSKPNPMPESVRDRCTKSHEYIFLLTKSRKYYYDHEAIKEPVTLSTIARLDQDLEQQDGSNRIPGKTNGPMKAVGRRPQMQRALELANQAGLTQTHFDAIRAVGMSDAGRAKLLQTGSGKNAEETIRLADEAKAVLGGYYREFLSRKSSGNKARKPGSERGCPEGTGSNVCGSVPWEGHTRNKRSVWSVSTKPFKEAHFATFPEDLIVPCILAGCPPGGVVLDPFMGAGTTAVVARRLGRNYLGYELNAEYVSIANHRLDKRLGPLDRLF